ncbi:hypothetical protein OHS33_39250 (plasmid) [Streptomyces sp. NBC_00536]|uniref:DUF6884 domain-containing protein n=1 Tax=Streptomyces sp. NBC_00536 TaxID=2975769 RepID=UPI002E806BE4|nr:DUF6884 domain-containing protein [Streptomyces sp. NBC_00536]WUC84397.1 hypothetical protein OHS33_39250 [Streptomyces sp. NBC_00536]
MPSLSDAGAAILAAHKDGRVRGAAAAITRLAIDGFVLRDVGNSYILEDGYKALEEWRRNRAGLAAFGKLPKLPGQQHEALLTAAGRADQRVPGRDDRDVYVSGETWYRTSTLRAVHAAGHADFRRAPGEEQLTYAQTGRSLYLTPQGREYVRQRGHAALDRRRVVVIACGSEKKPDPGVNQYGNRLPGYPAGELYTGRYHRSLRLAADSLTDPALIRIFSARHGLVELTRFLDPYDVTIRDERAITPERLARQAAELGADDADVIFLGGREYAELLAASIPHLLSPLWGGMGGHRGLCKTAREDADLRKTWWLRAAEAHARFHPTL